MKISLVIPAFNEAQHIESVLMELEAYMTQYMGNSGWEIIVVNDGSTDNTLKVLNHVHQSKNWLKVIDMMAHHGRGRALRRGLEESSGNTIISLDADLSYAPYHIERLVRTMEAENADIVLASAYGRGGTVKNVPWNRLFISRLGNKILSYMFGGGLTVLTCLVKAYKKEFIKTIDLNSDDKEIHLEILYKSRMLGGKIAEAPADLYWREQKLSKSFDTQRSKRRSTLKFKKTSNTHLFFALLNRPGVIFWIPGCILSMISLLIFIIICNVIIGNVANGMSIYFAIRKSMLTAVPSWLTMVISFVLGFQFFTLGFLTNQSKYNYEETYKTLHAIFAEERKKNR